MPGPFRETKVTDFFQRQPSLRISNDPSPTLSQSLTISLPWSAPKGNPNPSQSVPVKRKPGRPKGSGKKAKQNHDQPTLVSLGPSSRPGGSSGPCVPPLLSSGSPPPRPGTSGPSSKRQPRQLKKGRNKTENNNEERRLLRSSRRPALRGSPDTIPPLDPASQHRSRVLYNSPKENSSSQASVPSKRKLDDDDETASITSSGVPLSLYCMPRQTSSLSPSKPPESPLTTDNSSPPQTKKRRSVASPVPHSLLAPVTPKRARGMEVIPTSQSSEAGLYSPIRPNLVSQRKNDVQESVDNWRHGRSAYRCNIVSPPRFSPGVDYSMEVNRPLSPLTSYVNSTSLGSSLTSFTDADAIPSDVDPERPPSPLAQHSLPTPSSSSEGQAHGSPIQIVKPPVRPVTPPPSSPEQEPVPVAPKDSKARTAEIVAEIWANVRAKSVPDTEDSYLHVPINDELSSEEEDDEPFWKKRTKTPARHLTPASTYLHPSLPSPSSPSPSVLPDDSLPLSNDHNDDD
ncbi:hypothetical protein F5888DRAFT_1802262 [Russula emetica]|nr:hypothetical protein F5888DRAFT_1802262 [Russula emetica]